MIVLQVTANEERMITVGRDFVVQLEDVGIEIDWVGAGEGIGSRIEAITSAAGRIRHWVFGKEGSRIGSAEVRDIAVRPGPHGISRGRGTDSVCGATLIE